MTGSRFLKPTFVFWHKCQCRNTCQNHQNITHVMNVKEGQLPLLRQCLIRCSLVYHCGKLGKTPMTVFDGWGATPPWPPPAMVGGFWVFPKGRQPKEKREISGQADRKGWNEPCPLFLIPDNWSFVFLRWANGLLGSASPPTLHSGQHRNTNHRNTEKQNIELQK